MARGPPTLFARLVRRYGEEASAHFGKVLNLQLVKGERVSEDRFRDEIWLFIVYVLGIATVNYTTKMTLNKQREIAMRIPFIRSDVATRDGTLNMNKFGHHITGTYNAFCRANFAPRVNSLSPTTTIALRSQTATIGLSDTCSHAKVMTFIRKTAKVLWFFLKEDVV